MSMNNLGKLLVLLHTSASLVALSWAAALFLQWTDWGWKEPRKDGDVRIASEFDKRTAAMKEAIKARDTVLPAVAPAQRALREAENSFGVNHLVYVQALEELRTSPKDIEIKEVKIKDGKLELDGKKATARPVMENKIEGLTKSFAAYFKDLEELQKNVDKEAKEVRDNTEKVKDITFALTGKDDTGNVVKTGLYDLLNREKEAQDEAMFEREYIRPHWATALEKADAFRNREVRLQATLDRLLKNANK